MNAPPGILSSPASNLTGSAEILETPVLSADQAQPATISAAQVVQLIGKIVAMSQRLFPGPVSIDYSYEPENPADEYLIFDVVAEGEYADYRERIFKWDDEVAKIVPGSFCEFRLNVLPRR